jgi:membrane-associated protease RseP (regulator of RpoE activity)
MKRILGALFLMMCLAGPASAASITWSVATASDDNAGAFLAGASTSAVANIWTLLLPNYSTSGNFGLSPNEVDLAVSATASGGTITGVTYSFFGVFGGAGLASFNQTANATVAAGSFSTPVQTAFLSVLPTTVLNLATIFNLDGGDVVDLASVTKVQFELRTVDAAVPEPATFGLVGIGAVLLFRKKIVWRSRRASR